MSFDQQRKVALSANYLQITYLPCRTCCLCRRRGERAVDISSLAFSPSTAPLHRSFPRSSSSLGASELGRGVICMLCDVMWCCGHVTWRVYTLGWTGTTRVCVQRYWVSWEGLVTLLGEDGSFIPRGEWDYRVRRNPFLFCLPPDFVETRIV